MIKVKCSLVTSMLLIGNSLLASKSTMITSGRMDNASNWSNTTNVDTLIIPAGKQAEFHLNTAVFLGVKNIQLYGNLTPSIVTSGGADILVLDTNAKIDIYGTGKVGNFSGNNSNHAIKFGPICVWGKHCCTGNNTIIGVNTITSTNPCNLIVLNIGDGKKPTVNTNQNKITDKNGDVVIYVNDAEWLRVMIFEIATGKSTSYVVESNKVEIKANQNQIIYIKVIDNNSQIVEHKTIKL